jgi:nucleotide-binding universal stress UspA family protein
MKTRLERILCTTDFSDLSNCAVPYGVRLAKEFGAKLYLCHVIDLTSAAIYGEAVSAFEEQQNRMVGFAQNRIEDLIGKESIDWEPLVATGQTADRITRLAIEKEVDLAVSANRGRSGLKRLILGSVTERLMRTLPCPLLVVRSLEPPLESPADQEIRFRRILVGCDFSHDSDLALEYALDLARQFQSELHLVHVVEPPVYKDLCKPAAECGKEGQGSLRERLLEQLAQVIPEEARSWCSSSTALLAGQPHEELTKYAVVHDVDLIVLGIRGHSLVESLFIGSTTARVVRRASCPVLSVRPTYQGSPD